MPIPDFQTLMLPVLQTAADGGDHEAREVRETLAVQYHLTDEERRAMLPSGRARLFDNRMHWAISTSAGRPLLERSRRGTYRITDRGRQVLAENPERINIALLTRFADFSVQRQKGTSGVPAQVKPPEATTRRRPWSCSRPATSNCAQNWPRNSFSGYGPLPLIS